MLCTIGICLETTIAVQLEMGFQVRPHPNYPEAFAIYKNGKRFCHPGMPVYHETEQGALNRAKQIIERMKDAELQRQADLPCLSIQSPGSQSKSGEV